MGLPLSPPPRGGGGGGEGDAVFSAVFKSPSCLDGLCH